MEPSRMFTPPYGGNRPQRLSTSPFGANRAQRRKAEHDKLRKLTDDKRKSRVAKRMDRPEKLEISGRGWQKFDAILNRIGVRLA